VSGNELLPYWQHACLSLARGCGCGCVCEVPSEEGDEVGVALGAGAGAAGDAVRSLPPGMRESEMVLVRGAGGVQQRVGRGRVLGVVQELVAEERARRLAARFRDR